MTDHDHPVHSQRLVTGLLGKEAALPESFSHGPSPTQSQTLAVTVTVRPGRFDLNPARGPGHAAGLVRGLRGLSSDKKGHFHKSLLKKGSHFQMISRKFLVAIPGQELVESKAA